MKKSGVIILISICFVQIVIAIDDHSYFVKLSGAKEVASGIFDDNENTAFISIKDYDHDKKGAEIVAIAEIWAKKREWQNKFPDKKITAMTTVTGDRGGMGHSITIGLLMHYNK